MNRYQLADLIRRHGVAAVGEAVTNPSKRVLRALEDGWDLDGWDVRSTAGAVAFGRYGSLPNPLDPDSTTSAAVAAREMVLCINGRQSERARWEAELADTITRTPTVLLMTPAGVAGEHAGMPDLPI